MTTESAGTSPTVAIMNVAGQLFSAAAILLSCFGLVSYGLIVMQLYVGTYESAVMGLAALILTVIATVLLVLSSLLCGWSRNRWVRRFVLLNWIPLGAAALIVLVGTVLGH